MLNPLELTTRSFTPEELEEVFPRPPLREVVFEVRFSPRLRVPAEIWKLQDQLVSSYPAVNKEPAIQANGTVTDVAVFQSPAESRVVKVSYQSFLVAFSRYTKFEDFREELKKRTDQFCSIFGIDAFTRVGLRYVNEISVPSQDPFSLLTYVRPYVNFERFPLGLVDQFAVELLSHYRDHLVTLRSALLPGLLRTYVLDIDCHTGASISVQEYTARVNQFHDSAQRLFLDHITDEFKEIMRGKK